MTSLRAFISTTSTTSTTAVISIEIRDKFENQRRGFDVIIIIIIQCPSNSRFVPSDFVYLKFIRSQVDKLCFVLKTPAYILKILSLCLVGRYVGTFYIKYAIIRYLSVFIHSCNSYCNKYFYLQFLKSITIKTIFI